MASSRGTRNVLTSVLWLGAIGALVLVILGAAAPARALPIGIDVGAYAGRYIVDGVFLQGSQTLDLTPGGHSFTGQSEEGFGFVVGADGTVASVNNAVAASALGSTLVLHNALVQLDTGAYVGRYYVLDAYPLVSRLGPSTVTVIPGLRARIDNGTAVGGSEFAFRALADGTIVALHPNAAFATGSTLHFRNVTIEIDPAAYVGHYRTSVNGAIFSVGPRTLVAIPSLRYGVDMGGGIGASSFGFLVDADGTVVSSSAAASGDGNRLVFANRTVTVDAGAFVGGWTLTSHFGPGFPHFPVGGRTVVLVPALRYRAVFGGLGGMELQFDVQVSGDVTPTSPLSATAVGSSLRFRTEIVRVAPSTATNHRVGIHPYTASASEATYALVPNMRWSIDNGASLVTFALSTPCAVDPPTVVLAGTTYSITCGELDADDDGVPDDTDVCPLVPDPAQLDLDDDGLGDVCDPDLDGDGVANVTDVCPDIADDQTDLDHDGVGDPCDSDADGDLVEDAVDNCIGTPNPDQADGDGDLEGDACDADDDADGVPDGGDNCALVYNANQTDADHDGQGDACDGDDDGDGVPDTSDLCGGSPTDLPIDTLGCTGAQRIALRCRSEDFVNHGQYVSCVAREATAARREGLITDAERSRIVSGAARSR